MEARSGISWRRISAGNPNATTLWKCDSTIDAGKRLPAIDANLSEEELLEVTKNQKQHKGCSVGEELQEQPALKIPKEPRNEKLSEPQMQLKG